ncbi:putative mitochondrial 3-hydroxyisobutyryl- hydrolase protein [Neofusicoccum parvum UCRNP2]|uniref:3-hydroxyisobutyryl-CoA hydrolase n=1 Tax=Botryosphaeria parva (strain UCR-NP2) TaxID=1287680 RepID=R1EB21_BOTPV|nr:putative mitochondrial 3-hydroxyisobutyryl- hydrolase protein [Neofusicoccum parvum UCRNP2]
MPLRAKIMPSPRQYATASEAELVKPQPEDNPDDVLFDKVYGVRTIELNRPKKLNSLDGSMARKIIPRLREWSRSQLANVVIIKGNGRAFCAGGDVAALAEANTQGAEGQQKSKDYFGLEYKLDHLIATYSKPYIAFMDGITMGGGVGLSVHAPFRIATENTVFAMPETTIGFFPDVGASFFLPRMDGEMGTYLALTSEQLKGVDVFYHGIATHYIHSSSLPDLEARLAELDFKDYLTLQERHAIINATIEEFVTGLPAPKAQISGELRVAVDECFKSDTISEIIDKLSTLKGSNNEQLSKWAAKTIDTIEQRSPTSVLVALKQLRVSKTWGIADTFRHEYNIASRFMEHKDFVEGVTARLVRREKARPNWQPNTFKDVPEQEVDSFFNGKPTLQLLNPGEENNYKQYPHAWLGLPRESVILETAKSMQNDRAVIQHFVREYKGKAGVKEKVEEVLERSRI